MTPTSCPRRPGWQPEPESGADIDGVPAVEVARISAPPPTRGGPCATTTFLSPRQSDPARESRRVGWKVGADVKKLADYGQDDHPADDPERAQAAWVVAALDDC